MAKNTTLTNIMARIRNLADTGDSGWMDDTNLTAWINLEVAAFRDLMVEVWPQSLATSTTQAITAGTDSYSLPADFFYLCGVDVLSGGRYVPMAQAMFTERADFAISDLYANQQESTRYMVVGSTLTLVPKPQWNGTVKIWYVPAMTDLSVGSPTLDGVNGWDTMVIFGVLGHIEGKRGGDPSYWVRERQRTERRIRAMAAARSMSEPTTIRDVESERAFSRRPFRRW